MAWRAHTWETVLAVCRADARADPRCASVADLVERIAASRYAPGLHPVLAMHTLRVHATAVWFWNDDRIFIEPDLRTGEVVVRYEAGPYLRSHTLLPVESRWERRGGDGFAAFERCLRHLRWFVDYSPAPPP